MGWLNHLNEQHRLILILWLLLMAGGPESVVGKKTTRKPMTTNRVGSSGITPTLNKITAPASSPKVDSSESYLPTEHIDLVDPIRTQFDLEGKLNEDASVSGMAESVVFMMSESSLFSLPYPTMLNTGINYRNFST